MQLHIVQLYAVSLLCFSTRGPTPGCSRDTPSLPPGGPYLAGTGRQAATRSPVWEGCWPRRPRGSPGGCPRRREEGSLGQAKGREGSEAGDRLTPTASLAPPLPLAATPHREAELPFCTPGPAWCWASLLPSPLGPGGSALLLLHRPQFQKPHLQHPGQALHWRRWSCPMRSPWAAPTHG